MNGGSCRIVKHRIHQHILQRPVEQLLVGNKLQRPGFRFQAQQVGHCSRIVADIGGQPLQEADQLQSDKPHRQGSMILIHLKREVDITDQFLNMLPFGMNFLQERPLFICVPAVLLVQQQC
ncbi:hypothetical protein D3C75_932780 [compost metagenome]